MDFLALEFRALYVLIFPTLPNFTDVEDTSFGNIMTLKCLLQLPWGFKYIFLSENPRSPMHSQGILALGIFEHSNGIMRISMRRAKDMTRSIGSDRDKA
jgi:hypothetical protein